MSDDQNLQIRRIEGVPRLDSRSDGASLEQVREMLDQTRNNLLRTQRRIERYEKHSHSLTRQMRLLWVLMSTVLAGLGLLTFYQLIFK